MRRTLLPFVLLGVAAPAWATPTDLRTDQYWRLRDRLGAFMIPDSGVAGGALAATWRSDVLRAMKWSDATITLGWWLGVLATEHALLTDPTYDSFDDARAGALAANRTALRSALLTLDRLDAAAEPGSPQCLGGYLPWPANGYLSRDDVASPAAWFPGIDTFASDGGDFVLTNKEMSQDQAWHLLLGLALVIDLVPPGTIEQGMDLRDHAVGVAARIGRHVSASGWQIQNPACDRPVTRGADATAYSVGAAAALDWMTGGAVSPNPPWTGQVAWPTLQSPANPAYLNADNLHMAMAVIATSDGYGANTLAVLDDLEDVHGWVAYPLVHEVLHGPGVPGWGARGPAFVLDAHAMLDELGAQDDIASPNPFPGTHGWGSAHRFLREAREHVDGADGSATQRYPGVDWMLLHNVAALADPGAWAPLRAEIAVSPPGPVCPGTAVTFSAPPEASTYAWALDGQPQSTAAAWTWTAEAGSWRVDLEVTGAGRTLGESVDLVVPDAPALTLVHPDAVCRGAQVEVRALGAEACDWRDADGEGCTAWVTVDPGVVPTVTGTTGACSTTTSVSWRVDEPPTGEVRPEPESAPVRVGAPLEVVFDGTGEAVAWTVAAGRVLEARPDGATVVFDAVGDHAVSAEVVDGACATTLTSAPLRVVPGDEGGGGIEVTGGSGCGCASVDVKGTLGGLGLGLFAAGRRRRARVSAGGGVAIGRSPSAGLAGGASAE